MEGQCWQAGSTVRRWQATELPLPWHCSPGLLSPGGRTERGSHTTEYCCTNGTPYVCCSTVP